MLVFISDIHLRAGRRTNVPRVEQLKRFWQRSLLSAPSATALRSAEMIAITIKGWFGQRLLNP